MGNTVTLLDKILAQLEELETQVSIIRALGCRPYVKDKKPYKCPVCDGVGHLYRSENKDNMFTNFEFYREHASCHACEGKGIVWG